MSPHLSCKKKMIRPFLSLAAFFFDMKMGSSTFPRKNASWLKLITACPDIRQPVVEVWKDSQLVGRIFFIFVPCSEFFVSFLTLPVLFWLTGMQNRLIGHPLIKLERVPKGLVKCTYSFCFVNEHCYERTICPDESIKLSPLWTS